MSPKDRIRVDVWASNREKVETYANEMGLSPQEAANVIIAAFFSEYMTVRKNEGMVKPPKVEPKTESKTEPKTEVKPANNLTVETINYADDF
jgi:hypothetical protein